MKKKQDWLNLFVEKNIWSILAVIIGLAIFYNSTNFRIKAQDRRITILETAISDIVENQKKIIILTEHQKATDENIRIIKQDIKDIKIIVNKL